MNPLLLILLSTLAGAGANKLFGTSPEQPTAVSDPMADPRRQKLMALLAQLQQQNMQPAQNPASGQLQQIMAQLMTPQNFGQQRLG